MIKPRHRPPLSLCDDQKGEEPEISGLRSFWLQVSSSVLGAVFALPVRSCKPRHPKLEWEES
jgi:hypothetical protein